MERRIKAPETSRDLFTADGKRKYLTAEERSRFLEAAQEHSRGEVRSFCEVLVYTGYRITEALAREITFRTLKQRNALRYRAVPVPESLIDTLNLVHSIRKARRRKVRAQDTALWPWSSTQGWKHMAAVMAQAGFEGPHASPKGLRHCFGVMAATQTRNPRLVQKWLGHRDLNTTAIYMDAVGEEERELAARMWRG